eukprot:6474055-Amphidinium_carterae.1
MAIAPKLLSPNMHAKAMHDIYRAAEHCCTIATKVTRVTFRFPIQYLVIITESWAHDDCSVARPSAHPRIATPSIPPSTASWSHCRQAHGCRIHHAAVPASVLSRP